MIHFTYRGRRVVGGYGEGAALVSRTPISFYGGINPETGVVVEHGHELEGESVSNRILVFPTGKGSTVGSYTIYQMKKFRTAPAAIVMGETEIIVATGCAMAGIPLVDRLEADHFESIASGDHVRVYGDKGQVEVERDQ